MISTFASGTLSSTAGGTEDFLSSPNVQGIFTLKVDLNAMLAGDVVELRIYGMGIAGGTSRRVYISTYSGVPPVNALIAYLPAIQNELTDTNALRFSLTQTVGSSRSFPWAVMKDDALTPTTSGNTLDVASGKLSGAFAELGVGVPTATPTLEQAQMLLYMALRNALLVDSSALFKYIANNAGSVIAKKAITTTATTYTEAKMVAGP